MNRPVALVALALFTSSVSGACSSEDPVSDGNGGSSGGGAIGGTSGGSAGTSGGSAGSSGTTGGVMGTGGDLGGSAGTSSGASGTSGTAGTNAGGAGGESGSSSGDAGIAGVTGGAVIGGAGGAGGAGGVSTGGVGGGGRGGVAGNDAGGGGGPSAMMNFFVTSDTSANGNLGGLMMADMRCQTLAGSVGQGSKTWRAYLSVQTPMTNAIDRIGNGPYYNYAGTLVAMNKTELHARSGDPALFLTERGTRVNGQWQGSPTPNQHDVLTGSQRNGMLMTGATCGDWMATTGNVEVGHSDGLGPSMMSTGNLAFWNASHTSPCNDLPSTGGAGKLYCFVGP